MIATHENDCISLRLKNPSYVEVHGRRRGTPGISVPDMFQRNHHLKESIRIPGLTVFFLICFLKLAAVR